MVTLDESVVLPGLSRFVAATDCSGSDAGRVVGNKVGSIVGWIVGNKVGCDVSWGVGDKVGCNVGWIVGVSVDAQLIGVWNPGND